MESVRVKLAVLSSKESARVCKLAPDGESNSRIKSSSTMPLPSSITEIVALSSGLPYESKDQPTEVKPAIYGILYSA